MRNRRLHPSRWLLALLLLLLVLFLLELNQWLPGTWPGGGGGGWQARALPAPAATPPSSGDPGEGRPEAPERVRPRDSRPAGERPDESTLVTVAVQGPDGTLLHGWRLGLGSGGPEEFAPRPSGLLALDRATLKRMGFRIRHEGGLVRHLAPREEVPNDWLVAWPTTRLPAARVPQSLQLVLTDAASNTPLADRVVEWQAAGSGETGRATSDAEGMVQIPKGTSDLIRATLPGDGPKSPSKWFSLREGHGRIEWPVEAVDEELPLVRFQSVTRPSAVFWSVPGRPGVLPLTLVPDETHPYRYTVVGRSTTLPGARVEARFDFADGGDALLPLYAPVGREPQSIAFETRGLAGPNGEPLPAGTWVEVFAPLAGGPPGDAGIHATIHARSDGHSPTVLHAPLDSGELEAVIRSPRHAPTAVRMPAGGSATVALEAGRSIGVAVFDEAGRPVPGVQVAARVSVGSGQTRVDAVAGKSPGLFRLGPLGPEALDVRVTGFGWAGQEKPLEAAGEATPPIDTDAPTLRFTMLKGLGQTVVVSSPSGLPIRDAAVHVFPDDNGVPWVEPDGATPARTDDWGHAVVPPVLPDRIVQLQVVAPGYSSAIVSGVKPGRSICYVTLVPAD